MVLRIKQRVLCMQDTSVTMSHVHKPCCVFIFIFWCSESTQGHIYMWSMCWSTSELHSWAMCDFNLEFPINESKCLFVSQLGHWWSSFVVSDYPLLCFQPTFLTDFFIYLISNSYKPFICHNKKFFPFLMFWATFGGTSSEAMFSGACRNHMVQGLELRTFITKYAPPVH